MTCTLFFLTIFSILTKLSGYLDTSDFIWNFRKLPFSSHLGKYFIKIGKISPKIHEIGKIMAIFVLGMTPILGRKNGQIKSLDTNRRFYHDVLPVL